MSNANERQRQVPDGDQAEVKQDAGESVEDGTPKGHARASPRRTFAKDANLCAPGTRTVYYLAESLARKGARIISMRPRASQPVKDCAGCS
jgi:hypothetical protein